MTILVLASHGMCVGKITKDFYLEGTEKEKTRPLPNTLIAELCVGESRELYVEAYPDGEGSFSWELLKNDGTVSIFPSGEKCMLLANEEGEEKILVHLRGGESAEISVRVNPAPRVNARSFEVEEREEKREEILALVLCFLVRGLVLGGAGLLCFALISFVGKRMEK